LEEKKNLCVPQTFLSVNRILCKESKGGGRSKKKKKKKKRNRKNCRNESQLELGG